ncbi:MAG: ParB/RepB/Spo0J family partition protein, partial [Planctomycetota bacterium]|nr:ParB/RepB/Spo0J family partition protein [Planctomycetota bacterium]MDI6788711.1 ParB/RepB/Spo0J family partition protein [Planctomycetota bacterium]
NPPIPQLSPVSSGTVPYIKPSGSLESIVMVKAEALIPNRFQPRKIFDKESLNELMESIRVAGVLQPILVRKSPTTSEQSGNYYEIVAGERRWRACLELKIESVPVIIKEVDDQKMLEWALIENTQRKDLNPIERARAYKELSTFFNLTQEEIARKVGVDRATVANFIRILDLPDVVQQDVANQTISTTHARYLLSLEDQTLQVKLAQRIKKQGMSVRRLEYIIRWLKRRRPSALSTQIPSISPHLREIEERLMRKFQTKVNIYSPDNKQGKIYISFYSIDDFQRILDKLEQV